MNTNDRRGDRGKDEGGRMKDEKPTLAEIAVKVLKQTKNDAVMSGDNGLLDQIAFTYAKTTGRTRITENDLHPINNRKNCRHQRILNALERRPDLFTKKVVRGVGWNRSRLRLFTLNPEPQTLNPVDRRETI